MKDRVESDSEDETNSGYCKKCEILYEKDKIIKNYSFSETVVVIFIMLATTILVSIIFIGVLSMSRIGDISLVIENHIMPFIRDSTKSAVYLEKSGYCETLVRKMSSNCTFNDSSCHIILDAYVKLCK
jgi:hypothetical protein